MAKKSMYEIIKKQNGERFAKAIRNYDSGIFDVPHIDEIVKYAGHEAEPIMNYLVSLKKIRIEEMAVHMDPIALLKKAGYDAYVADTLAKQNAIKKYFARGEELCTFNDPYRFENYYIINAVHKDADKLKREDFLDPEREDKYGTSVISIQVLKDGGFISIKNRYNHTVENPDNTFNSNPDSIIPGLGDSIRHYFDVDFSSFDIPLPKNFVLVNNQICKYTSEVNNIYFGNDFYIQDGVITKLNTQFELMLGRGMILDLRTKTVKNIATDEPSGKFIEDAIKDKKIQLTNSLDGGKVLIAGGEKILEVRNGEISWLNTPNAEEINLNKFLQLRGTQDFSNVKILKIKEANFAARNSFGDVIFNPNADEIHFSGYMNIPKKRDFNFSNVKRLYVEQLNIEKLRLNPNADVLYMSNMTIPENHRLDFSGVKKLRLSVGYNFNVAETVVNNISLNPNAQEIKLSDMYLITNLILDNAGDIDLQSVKLDKKSKVNIGNVEKLNLESVTGLSGQLDFSHVNNLTITNIETTNITDLKLNPNANLVQMSFGPAYKNKNFFADKILNLTNVRNIHLNYIAGIKQLNTNPNAKSFSLSDVNNIGGTLNLGNVGNISISKSDLTGTDIKFNPNAYAITLTNVKGLRGVLDFSNVASLDLSGTDLSQVTDIKIHPNAHIVGEFSGLLGRMNQNAFINGISVIEQKRIEKEKLDKKVIAGELTKKSGFYIDNSL